MKSTLRILALALLIGLPSVGYAQTPTYSQSLTPATGKDLGVVASEVHGVHNDLVFYLKLLDTDLAAAVKQGQALAAVEAPFQGAVPMTLDVSQPPQRAVRIICTTAGNVSLTYADGSKDVIPVNVGLSSYAGAFTTVNSAGTTAAATFANLK